MATAGIYDDNYPDSASSVADDEHERAPPDGIFERRAPPRESFKPSPGLSPAEAKAKEAAEQQTRFGRGRGEASAHNRDSPPSRASSAASSSILTPSSARARSPARVASEQTPLLDADQAPPSYSDATAGRPYRPEQRAEQEPMIGNYGSIPASARADILRGMEEARQGVAAGRREAERGVEESRQAAAAGSREAGAATGRADYDDFHWPFGNRGNPFGPNGPWPFGNGGNPFGRNGPWSHNGTWGHNGPWGHRGPFGPHGLLRAHGAAETGRESMSDPHSDHRGRGRGGGRGHGRRWDRGRWRQWRDWHDHDHDHDEENDSVREPRKPARTCTGKRSFKERCCKPWHICSWILAGLIIFLIVLIVWIARGAITKSKTPYKPSHPSESFPEDPYLQHPSTYNCRFVNSGPLYIEPFKLEQKQSANFTLLERIESSGATDFSDGISGTISIVGAPSNQTEDIVVVMHMATTAMLQIEKPDLVVSDSAIEIREPFYSHTGSYPGECLHVAVKVTVREDVVAFSHFKVDALNLDVVGTRSLYGDIKHWDDGLTIKNTTINTNRGHVHLAAWASRETYISTMSGSVQGTYALKDVLSVTTKSGSVDVSVSPQKVDKHRPRPAELKIDTLAGSVKTDWVTKHGTPDRDYRCTVVTRSSSIQGDYVLGSLTSLTTWSGHITATIMPYDAGQKHAQLRTSSHSGSTDIYMTDPLLNSHFPYFWKDDASRSLETSKAGVLAHLTSSHESNSGSMDLLYPQGWLGTFSGHVLSGSVTICGEDVENDLEARLPVGKFFGGRKGIGNSKLKFSTTSGSVLLAIGDYDKERRCQVDEMGHTL